MAKKENQKDDKVMAAIDFVHDELDKQPKCDKVGRAYGLVKKLKEVLTQ